MTAALIDDSGGPGMFMLHHALLRLAGDLRGPLARITAVGWALFAARVGQAVLIGVVLGAVLDVDGAPSLVVSSVALAAVVAIRMVLVWARDVTSQRSAERIKVAMRDRLLAHLLALGPGHMATRRTGEVQATVVDGVEGLEAYYSRYLPQLVVTLTGPILVIAWMLIRAPLVGAVVLTAAVSVPLLPRLWDRLLTERGKDHWDAYGRLGADYLDAMQGMTSLKALDATATRGRQLRDRAAHLTETTMRQMGISLIDTGLTAVGSQIGVALAVGVGAVQVARGELDIATLSILLVLTAECFRPLQELSAQWHAGFLGISAADGIEQLLATTPPTADQWGADDLPDTAQAPEIRFEGVVLTYPGRTTPALDGVDLVVPADKTVAVVGRSGAGKTSLVSALLRLHPLEDGRILLDGHDVAEVSASSLRRHVSVVSQDGYLFHGTVADNLRLAAPDATDGALWAALQDADAAAFVRAMPEGLHSRVGDRGATLSGGQRQRITIARAILADAPVLVLDEPTSAIDADAEDRIMQTVRQLARGRTTIVIAHRLSTIRDADCIVVMADGRVVQQGSHADLVGEDGPYHDLVAAQAIGVGARPAAEERA